MRLDQANGIAVDEGRICYATALGETNAAPAHYVCLITSTNLRLRRYQRSSR